MQGWDWLTLGEVSQLATPFRSVSDLSREWTRLGPEIGSFRPDDTQLNLAITKANQLSG